MFWGSNRHSSPSLKVGVFCREVINFPNYRFCGHPFYAHIPGQSKAAGTNASGCFIKINIIWFLKPSSDSKVSITTPSATFISIHLSTNNLGRHVLPVIAVYPGSIIALAGALYLSRKAERNRRNRNCMFRQPQ